MERWELPHGDIVRLVDAVRASACAEDRLCWTLPRARARIARDKFGFVLIRKRTQTVVRAPLARLGGLGARLPPIGSR